MTKMVDKKKTPNSINLLLVAKMIKAEQDYYLHNTDIGVMLGIYIENQNN